MSATDGQGTNGGPRAIAVPQAQAGTTVRQGFGTQEVQRTGETASTALAEQAKAAVQARYVMALQRPRDMAKVRDELLKDCERTSFAAVAIYNKPVGEGIEGPSIRLAEAAARAMGNILTNVFAIHDDDSRRVIRVSATDLERNLTFDKDVTVHKTMERSRLREGQVPISVRTNSQNRKTYTVAAENDDDILNKENALASKAMRVCLLRLMPGDLIDDAMKQSYRTMQADVEKDPDRGAKDMCDAFRSIGVTIEQLKEYLGHPALETPPPELVFMKKLFMAISEGEATWSEAVDQKRGASSEPMPATKPAAGIDDLAARAKAQREGAAKPATTAAPKPQAKPADPADAISKGPGPGAKTGQQTIPVSKAAPAPMESDEDRRNREAAAPDPDEMPEFFGGPKR